MKFLLTIFFAILISVTVCKTQTPEKQKFNAISIELGKTGLIYNLTFDHKAKIKNFGFRVNAGSNFGKYLNAVSVGGGGYHLIGQTTRFLELGLDLQYLVVDEVSNDQRGFTIVYPDYSIKTFYPSLNVGYRAYGKRSLFRIGFSPGIIDGGFVPGGYVSYGFLF